MKCQFGISKARSFAPDGFVGVLGLDTVERSQITVQHDLLTSNQQDHLLDLFRLKQRFLVVHFGSPMHNTCGEHMLPAARGKSFSRGAKPNLTQRRKGTRRNAEKNRSSPCTATVQVVRKLRRISQVPASQSVASLSVILRCFRWNGRNSVPGCPRGHPEATPRPPRGHLVANR